MQFAGESARKLYSVIKERRFDWTRFEHYGAFLRRIDICHDRANKPTDTISNPQFIESTLAQFKVSLPNNSLKFEQNKMGQITAVGHRNSARYYRVYSKRKGESLRFEFEHKHRKTLNLYYSLLKQHKLDELEQLISYEFTKITFQLLSVAADAGNVVDLGTQLGAGSESAVAFGKIAFKTGRDIARGDAVCTGLCAVSGLCETVAIGCSTIKIIPFRDRIYVCVKIVSRGCMTYRNLCAGEGC